MSNIMTTPLQFLYTSRNSASRAISDSAWDGGVRRERRCCGQGPQGSPRVSPRPLGMLNRLFHFGKTQDDACSVGRKTASKGLAGTFGLWGRCALPGLGGTSPLATRAPHSGPGWGAGVQAPQQGTCPSPEEAHLQRTF